MDEGLVHEVFGSIRPTLADGQEVVTQITSSALQHTAGLNAEAFDALILLAAGSWTPAALRAGHAAVIALQREMDDGRRARLLRLGFSAEAAATLSALHTRNFM